MERRLAVLVLSAVAAQAQSTSLSQFFESRIRPIFVNRCQDCHNSKSKMGGLDLSTAAGFNRGAAGGPIVVAGEPEASRLIQAVTYASKVKMPPNAKIPDEEIIALRDWIRQGAVWPDENSKVSKADVGWWSFQPVHAGKPPAVKDEGWVRNEIDRFILAKLEQSGIQPAAPADKLTLLRRATYDLTGLPPTEAEVRAFLADSSEDAYRRVIDRLLASPRYGERWGRHWLDVARYADSTGADEDYRYPYAWRYRDYVIEAFNQDLPYNQFVREQIAGDMLPAAKPGDVNTRGIIATGFLALGPKLVAEQDKVKMFYDIVDEQIDTTGKAFLGLTLACARCHDHKFDPIPTADYYSLASIFASTKQLSKLEGTVSQLYFAPLVPKDEAAVWEKHKQEVDAKQKQIDEVVGEESARYRDRLTPQMAAYMLAAFEIYNSNGDAAAIAKRDSLDPAILGRWVDYLKPNKDRRPHLEEFYAATAANRREVTQQYQDRFANTTRFRREARDNWKKESAAAKAAGKEPPPAPKFMAGDDRFYTEVTAAKGPFALPEKDREALFLAASREKLAKYKEELELLKKAAPPEPPLACGVAEDKSISQHIFIRGNPTSLGPEVPKRLPRAVAGEKQAPIAEGSGRRELADWIASPSNPLTARVMANRIWQWHFGEGLVRTPSNYGRLGEKPTHPELLDWLADRFVAGNWSLKSMHRMIMMSNAYRMSGLATPTGREKDPANRMFAWFPQRRLTVEEIRDSLLTVDGSLEEAVGGSLLTGAGFDKEFSDARRSMNPDSTRRRTVYLPLRRSNLASLFNLFDFGDATNSMEGRTQSNVAPQALFMMNSKFVEDRSAALAKELLAANVEDQARAERAIWRILRRPPNQQEALSGSLYVSRFPGSRELAWTSYCRTLVASNEFLYLH